MPLISSNPTINAALPSPPPSDVSKHHIYIFFSALPGPAPLDSSELWLSSESLVFTENMFCFSKEVNFSGDSVLKSSHLLFPMLLETHCM